ncbi:MAG: hypothetical protein IT316_13260 [Anaerolineales bacterium]|nr:hypothetical protein [Anaerolineales bacterium]
MPSQELPFGLQPQTTPGAQVEAAGRHAWRLSIPAGPGGRYRLAQLDNYKARRRAAFPHRAPFSLALEARASAPYLRGTWGFGVWNDPFSMGALTGDLLRFPALPNTAWFFFASPENYLALRDDLPASGTMAATFHSPRGLWRALALGAIALPLMALPPGRRMARRLAARVVQQDTAPLDIDPSAWHSYRLEWQAGQVRFEVDGDPLLCTAVSPCGPLGLVVWIDNQYAAFRPDGGLGYGTLETRQPAWIEVRNLRSE